MKRSAVCVALVSLLLAAGAPATADEIGYARDAFGFKPLIVAESDEFVALCTEEIALHGLAGPEISTFEPPAGSVCTWNINEMRSVA